jgi:hypothetical protein
MSVKKYTMSVNEKYCRETQHNRDDLYNTVWNKHKFDDKKILFYVDAETFNPLHRYTNFLLYYSVCDAIDIITREI